MCVRGVATMALQKHHCYIVLWCQPVTEATDLLLSHRKTFFVLQDKRQECWTLH